MSRDCTVELKWDDTAQQWCAWYQGEMIGVGYTKGRALRDSARWIDIHNDEVEKKS